MTKEQLKKIVKKELKHVLKETSENFDRVKVERRYNTVLAILRSVTKGLSDYEVDELHNMLLNFFKRGF